VCSVVSSVVGARLVGVGWEGGGVGGGVGVVMEGEGPPLMMGAVPLSILDPQMGIWHSGPQENINIDGV